MMIAQERRTNALELYKRGWSYRKIANEIGISFKQVGRHINSELDWLAKARYLGVNAAEKVDISGTVTFASKINEGMLRVNAADPDVIDAIEVECEVLDEPDPNDIPGVDTK